MARGFEAFLGGDSRVIVILHPYCKLNKEKILSLLGEVGVDPNHVIFLTPAEAKEHVKEHPECVLVPIDLAVLDELDLVEAARHCAQGGGGMVVILAEDTSFEGLHPIAADYGSQCGWSAPALKERITDGPVAKPPLGASGAPVPRPRSSPVKSKNC